MVFASATKEEKAPKKKRGFTVLTPLAAKFMVKLEDFLCLAA